MRRALQNLHRDGVAFLGNAADYLRQSRGA
jgi:hypothetical protein